MITNEHIEQYLAQAHRYGDAKLMLCSSGNLPWKVPFIWGFFVSVRM